MSLPTPVENPEPAPRRILVVDDEPDLLDVLCEALRHEGWDVKGAATGREAVRTTVRWRPDAVLLDMLLPDFDGLEVLRRIHAERPEVRVLFLTARDSVEDRINGIAAGGDDYITKPFSLAEVVVRLRGLLRRVEPPPVAEHEGTLSLADLLLDEHSQEVSRAGERIELSPTEYALLRHLLKHPRRVLSKEEILDAVWSYDFGTGAHVVEIYISYLRKKIDHGRVPLIHTVRGAGYVIKAPA